MQVKKTSLKTRQNIYKKVLKQITPSKDDILEEEKIFLEIKNKVSNLKGNHSHIEWCGSSARNTHLRGDRDLDLFVMFDEKMTSNELEKEGLRIGKNIFRGHFWEKAYSQHPYIRGNYKGFEVEIVPSYIVKSGELRKSAVDRTPFHNKYLLKNMKNTQKKEVRLFKQFLKGIGAYGADLKNCSLPGYAVELLILKYGNFEKTIKAISKWEEFTKIKFNNKKTIVQLDGPLVLIDPVDPNRNVASALNETQYQRIIFASNSFLTKPTINYFFPKKVKIWDKRKVKAGLLKKEIIMLKFDMPKNILEDIVWGQIRRFMKKTSNNLKENDFEVIQENLVVIGEKIYFIFELNNINLQVAKKLIGPKANDEENVEKFLKNKKNILSGPRIENGRIVIEIERENTSIINVLQKFIDENKKKERLAIKTMLRKAVILDEKKILKEYKGEFREFLTLYLKGKERFE